MSQQYDASSSEEEEPPDRQEGFVAVMCVCANNYILRIPFVKTHTHTHTYW